MAGRRVYGGSNMAMILQNEGISPETIESLLASGSPAALHGSRSMVNFENVHGSTAAHPFYQQAALEETGDDDPDECFHQPEKKRRLTANQVQFLERSFELENKLEPERKIQLARDLCLQPRQVAIWFQNRRARWKTKQLEKDYEVLKSNYNSLKTDYENLLKEKEKLKGEVFVLSGKLLLKQEGSNSEMPQLKDPNISQHQLRKQDPDSTSEIKNPQVPISICKQEDISSTNSAVFDSDSPRCTDEGGHSRLLEPADSSNVLEQDQSDLSHGEEDEEEKTCHFPKLEENSCNYEFPVEDHAFWFWP